MEHQNLLRRILDAFKGKTEEGNSLAYANLTDEELVKIFVESGNEGAFEEIVNRHEDKIYGLAFRITKDHHSAEEILQEVFITLIKKLGTFRGDAKFSSWLYRVALNATYMHLRVEKKRESEISIEGYAPYDEEGTLQGRIKHKDWSSRPDEALLSKEAMEIIEKAVGELPEPYRVVFILRDIEGFSNEEVAEVLKLSVPAIKSRLHRARLFLRDRLSDYFFQ